ncbi:MAG: GGDEF domain-containing protein [candidate division WOR-3 bacterium]|nr:MAG: GGDEF domain-containing protein [candidate division WOR-3 bacterium]
MKKTKKRNGSSVLIDDLTRIHNKRYLKEKQKDIEEFRVRNIPYSVMIVDIDQLKRINDTYGRAKGDKVLVEFSQFLKSSLRSTDIVVRYGGDEFVCVMPNSKRFDAEHVYKRIVRQCKGKKFGELDITISAGVASHPDDAEDFNKLLKIAVEALYDAKRRGRSGVGGIRKKSIESKK